MDNLQKLAELAGISSSYIDKTGKKHETSDEVRRFFLNAMDIKSQNNDEVNQSYEQLLKPQILPDVLAFYANESITFSLNTKDSYDINIIDEKNTTVATFKTENNHQTITLNLSDYGYYTISATSNNNHFESLLIYAPQFCHLPDFIKNKEHLYGTSIMLYALHSKNSMGIGDFSDLKEIIKQTAEKGGDAVGINPLGVMSPYLLPSPLFAPFKGDVSPYRTLSRLFINYIYLDLTKEPDFINSKSAQELYNSADFKSTLTRLNNDKLIHYAEVMLIKLRFLNLMYDEFNQASTPERKTQFENYKKEKSTELYNLALYETLLEKHPKEPFWRFWQDKTDDINSAQTKEFALKNARQIDFYSYCHWLADMALKSVQKYAKSLNMKIGIYADMPIGAASNGAEVWENPEAYVLDARVGAPADPMRPKGQSWGFNPYHPQTLKKQKYAPFIKLVRENMSFAGALRIDHAMGLRRLFWGFFTDDNPVLQGAYIYYDMKVLTAILSLESNRAKCLLIGEDLGTVPEGFREYMAEHGLLSYKVFFRQKEKDGSFIKPDQYMYMSLAQPSTHDQATSLGFWRNEDIEVFNRCNLYVNQEQYLTNLDGRRKDRENIIKAFTDEALHNQEHHKEMEVTAQTGADIPTELNNLVNIYGSRTNSALFFVRLCDIDGQQVLDNAPGTIDEYTNWRVKLKHSVEDFANTSDFSDMFDLIKKNRPA